MIAKIQEQLGSKYPELAELCSSCSEAPTAPMGAGGRQPVLRLPDAERLLAMTFCKCLLDPNLGRTELILLSLVFSLVFQFPNVIFGAPLRVISRPWCFSQSTYLFLVL